MTRGRKPQRHNTCKYCGKLFERWRRKSGDWTVAKCCGECRHTAQRKPKGVWDIYDGSIATRREEGATLREIGEEINVSKQRVDQIIKKHYGNIKRGDRVHLFNTAQLARLFQISTETINVYRRRGIIKPVGTSTRRPLYNRDAVVSLRNQRKCKVCGGQLPAHKWSYCSPECCIIGNYKSQKRVGWRRLHRLTGQPIHPSIDYVRPSLVGAIKE